MALDYTFYGELAEATTYFSMRLHATAWDSASDAERTSALYEARVLVDTLNYKGNKSAVYTLLEASPSATVDQIRAAEASQPLEFPRGADTVVPDAIKMAAYEIAYAILDGKDIEKELENLGISSQTFGPVKTVYDRNHISVEHLLNGIPSQRAWTFLKPFLRDDDEVKLARVS